MRAYRGLLFLYPSSFRDEYGAEMRAVFARRLQEAAGPAAAAGVWGEAVVDVLWNAARVHADVLLQDVRYTRRALGRSLGFTVTAIAVAALGVGATTTAFSITDHVLIRPLPFPAAERLVKLWGTQTRDGYFRVEVSPANYRDWQQASTSFESIAASFSVSANLVGGGEPERLDAARVTANLLPVLRVGPALGRPFSDADDREGAPGTVLLSHGLWMRRFGGDPSVVGRTVTLDDAPHLVIGVMPEGFAYPTRQTQIWTAMRLARGAFDERDDDYLVCIARLKDGITIERARADMQVVAGRLEAAYAENAHVGVNVLSLRDELSSRARLLVLAVLGAAVCVLLIACTNLASLLMARAVVRRSELTLRTALGAGRQRLVRQLLTESVLLASCGGALGVGLALLATPLVARLAPNALPIAEMPSPDLRMLAFAALVTAATAIAFGVAPSLRALRDADAGGLREGARGGIGRGREGLRSSLVVAQVALAVVLLVSAGLLIRALSRLQGIDPGFRTAGVITLRTALPLPKYEATQRRRQFYDRVLEDARALPGVTSAAYATGLPMAMTGGIWGITVAGRTEARGEDGNASLRFVTPGFFATLGIPVRAGRDLSAADTADAPFVAVVSESFARRYWPGQDPLGRRLEFGGTAHGPSPFGARTVVGVVADVRVRGPEQGSEPQLYLSYQQIADGSIIGYAPKDLVVASSVEPGALVPALRRIVARADPAQPISDVRTLAAIVDGETAPRAVQVRVLGAFAGVAILLAGIGIYGLLAFTVSSRAPEIGVRIALGAQARDILALVLRHGALLAAAGVALGVTLAYAAGRAMEALLAGVSPGDGTTFATAVAVAVLMTLAGSLVPALRALRVSPLSAMRAQ